MKKQSTKVKFDYAVFTLDDIKKQVQPTDAELKAFYDQNKQQYVNSIPEKRKARYILIDTAKLADKIQISQADLQQYYNQHQDEFRIPETVTVRHILIKTPVARTPDGKVDQKARRCRQGKAEDIEKQLKAGGNFAELAKKYSDDPGSAQEWRTCCRRSRRGRTVPEFEQAAFSTPVGPDHRNHPHQLRLPHHSCGRKQSARTEAAGRSQGADRAGPEAAEGGSAGAELGEHGADAGPHRRPGQGCHGQRPDGD